MENKVRIELSEEQIGTIDGAIAQIKTILDPDLIALTAKERQTLLKMGDGTQPFVEKTLEYAATNDSFKPPYLDVNELRIDLEAVKVLTHITRSIAQLHSNLEDTIMQAGSEAYAAGLAYYQSVKTAARHDILDAKTVYADLRARFERTSYTNADDVDTEIGIDEDGIG